MPRIAFAVLPLCLVWIAIGRTVAADPTSTEPVAGIRDNTPDVFALTNARIVVAAGRVIEKGTIVLRDGAIVAVGADVATPGDARVIDLTGRTVYPGLIDGYSEFTIDAGASKHAAPHWNPNVTPQLQVAEHFLADVAQSEKLRSQGITARLVAPASGIWKGRSALVATGLAGNHRRVLNPDVAMHLRLTVSRGGRDEYPNSPMGAVALARQTCYDAQWHRQAWQAHEADPTLPRPEKNDALDALQPVVHDRGLVIADAPNELYFFRDDRFAREFGLNLAVRGSGYEYRRLDAIAATGRAVIVPVNFPKPPNVGSPEAALNVSLEDLFHWQFAPENAGRLEKAGVKFALTAQGLKDVDQFLGNVRKAIERGLTPDGALRALTETPAELFGVANLVGSLERGKLANLVVTDGDLFDKKTKVHETWVLGRRYEIIKPPSFDLRGTWQVTTTDAAGKPIALAIELTGKADDLSGVVRPAKAKAGDAAEVKLAKSGLRDARFSTIFEGKPAGVEGFFQLSAVVAKGDSGLTWLGQLLGPDGKATKLTATHTPPAAGEAKTDGEPKPGDERKPGDDKKPEEDKSPPPSFALNYPLGDFGLEAAPEQPAAVVIQNATIWTCGPAGILKNASVLIREGRIAAVGPTVEVPPGAIVIDAAGKHVTPGIIDCHSHMATDGGINEGTQAVTAEVRIGDFIDCNDLDIYRQLAGGVTAANVLHGSANPIGGQNQVIKLRWGALPEEIKFAEAPQGIKFALGENVKQSNWGDQHTTRYPQTRMGVEQIMRDEFEAARRYQRNWEQWEKSHVGLPPRRDLELDAIVEVLGGRRWVHCHSYRQDEILALLRTCEDFNIRIATLQHILEGYKVADAMAKHGAMGSAFSDWWAYKFEVYDAIPYAGALMHNAGVVVSFNSDDRELARHLNHEAAKAIKYGAVPAEEALKFVTLNPAKQLRIEQHVGSIEPGKHADFVIWSGSPLSNFSRCEQTWIDGRKYFDLEADRQLRQRGQQQRTALIQQILKSGEAFRQPGEDEKDPSTLWPREDLFCHHHGHGGGQQHQHRAEEHSNE